MSPDKYTIKETFLEVGGGHTLYIQEWGNRDGLPVVYLHGGPGSGLSERHKQQFDPAKHRVVFFDQRGCGKSLPYGSLKNNTTADLVEDIEKISNHLKLRKFVLTGGSWGACLALAYGVKYPKKVKAMVLAGVFTGSYSEIDYFDKGVYKTYFPDIWEDFKNSVPKSHQSSPAEYHFKLILGDNEEVAKKSAYIYENLERSLLSLDDRFVPEAYEDFDRGSITMEVYYLKNRCFMPDEYIFNNAHKLTMPIWMAQGRYDMVCPGETAYKLHKLLPDSELIWTVSGHKNERESWNVMRNILRMVDNG